VRLGEGDDSRNLNQVQQKPDFTNHPASRGCYRAENGLKSQPEIRDASDERPPPTAMVRHGSTAALQ
jgi:hypothetical protein